jgi:hypothetical protein
VHDHIDAAACRLGEFGVAHVADSKLDALARRPERPPRDRLDLGCALQVLHPSRRQVVDHAHEIGTVREQPCDQRLADETAAAGDEIRSHQGSLARSRDPQQLACIRGGVQL